MSYKKYKIHHPYHLYEGRIFFITARVLKDSRLILDEQHKQQLKKIMAIVSRELGIKIFAWVILDTHYHILCDFDTHGGEGELTFTNPSGQKDRRGTLLSRFIRRLHSCSSKEFNLIDHTPARKVWYQYWDYCIRNIPDFWIHFNYIVQNPLKHGMVKTLYEAFEYPYSSNPVWLERFGRDGMWESFVKYSVRDWTPDSE